MVAQSPAALLGPCIERIHQGASGRKYSKLRQDAKALLGKLDTLLVLQQGVPHAVPGEHAAAAEAAASAAAVPGVPATQRVAEPLAPSASSAVAVTASTPVAGVQEEAEEQVEVSLQQGEDGKMSFKLTLSPSKLVAATQPLEEEHHAADPGHMPATPMGAAGSTGRPAAFRHSDSMLSRPGALHNHAARELLCFLRDAVDTRKAPVMEVALDCIQKLISFKLLQGPVHHINHRRDSASMKKDGDEESGPALDFDSLPPQAQALELACRCDDVSDDAVELRLLKALLTAVTSTTLAVHGQALLLLVRACYNIFLTSRSDVNQATAKATLTQMLNVVFQRMEAGSCHVVVPPIVVSDLLGLPPADASNMSAFVQQFLYDVITTVDPFGTVAQEIQQGLDEAFVSQTLVMGDGELVDGDLLDPSDPTDREQIHWRQQGSTSGEQGVEGGGAQQQQQQAAAAAAAEGEPGSGAAAAAVDGGVSPAVSSGALGEAGYAAGYAASTTSDLTSAIAALALSEHHGGGSGKQLSIPAQLQKDAFLVFRALCKLSIRSTEASPGSEITTLRGKVLALELLKILLENSGPLFRSTERFVTAIKQYLCLSLLKNCQSAVPAALRLCCSIFLTLMTKFRKSLKAEVGVFFPMILLRPIEPAVSGATPNAASAGGTASAPVDIAHKAVVLRCLQALCEDGQLLVDLFVNYDCDLEGANLFERMVTALVRIAQGSLAHEAGVGAQTPLEEQAIRYEALRCLVSLLKSMAAWHKSTTTTVVPLADGCVHAAAATTAGAEAATLGDEAVGANESMLESGWMAKMAESGLAASASEGTQPGGSEGDQRQAALLENWKGYKRQIQQGVTLFNQVPKKGIAFMQEHGLVGHAPEEVAQFLAKTQGLNKTLIGDYLGEHNDFNLRVMHCYIDALAFEDMVFDGAIRSFLSGFRLPGESQKIDRLMEKFAERFVSCNPESFKSADVAYVLAYSVIMLNTDAHNAQVKIKMSKADFLRNNRGINDGGDLPQDFMEALYDSIITNEIKMKDDPMGLGSAAAGAEAQKAATSAGWLDTIMNLIPGRAKAASAEPNDDAIRRTHEHLREKAKGATFFEAHDGEAIRPMLDVAWAPLLGAFSVLFEEYDDEYFVGLCLEGFVSSVWLTSLLDVEMLRNTFVTSLARFTMLHSPASMRLKHARAFRALLIVAEHNGNYLRECWTEVLRCVSRFELLQQVTAGVPTDALLFAMPDKHGASAADKLKRRIMPRRKGQGNEEGGLANESFSSIQNMGLHASTREVDKKHLPPADVMASVDVQELNRLFVNSGRLDSEAIVHFVKTLSAVAQEELRPVACPRVFSLTKIVEIAHFNMGRIRLVWTRIWAVLADFFIEVGCHANLAVAMYAVDSLRQLAMKFLERDELANFSFQNDFLRPFVVVMRHSRAVEIRELIIRCVSQMVLARVANVKSGWKSIFMVFTTAASDESPQIVRLAFDTVEKIVREHFHYITETETTTFTDCVNCLIAFTNNPHSLDVSLNAIAFLRFCALALAEGDIGDVEELPEGSLQAAGRHMDPNTFRIRPKGQDVASPVQSPSEEAAIPSAIAAASSGLNGAASSPWTASVPGVGGRVGGRIRFTDKDEHMYFWFPLLAGLSELTFDPRPEIRYSALEVLFDILKYHGSTFSPQFWLRVFDSVLLPIFDHVRAEVTDTTTFTDDKRRAEVDSWLYDTCTRTLQHIVDIVVQYYTAVTALLERILELLLGFVRRTHPALAGVGVAAMVRLIVATGPQLDEQRWMMMLRALFTAAGDTLPNVSNLIQHRMSRRTNESELEEAAAGGGGGREEVLREQFGVQSPAVAMAAAAYGGSDGGSPHHVDRRPSMFSLGAGAGARRLAEVHVRAGIQLLLVQACSEVYTQHSRAMPATVTVLLLDTLKGMASHAAAVDADTGLRHSLLLAQAADKVPPERALGDPPLLRLEAEASQAYLSVLLHIQAAAPEGVKAACAIEARLTQLCLRNLERFEQQEEAAEEEVAAGRGAGEGSAGGSVALHSEENRMLAPLAVATLRALLAFSPDAFRAHLKDFFPLLTTLISCEYAPPEVQRALSELFAKRIGPMLAT